MIPLFDLHCDTFLELYKKGQKIEKNNLHISLDKVVSFAPYIQICAIWSDYRLSNDEAYNNALEVINYASKEKIDFMTNLNYLEKNNFLLGIEDARLLNNDLNRLDELYSMGTRVLTLNWKGGNIIGGGWDTSLPLTQFGKSVIKHSSELGIKIDVSHSSFETFYDVIRLSEKLNFIPIASHSNSYSMCEHKRNLTDEQIKILCEQKSIIGISMVSEHLGSNSSIDTIIKHIHHMLSLGGENTIALGCDFDGTSNLPYKINSISDLTELNLRIIKEFGNVIARKIFFENAFSFFSNKL